MAGGALLFAGSIIVVSIHAYTESGRQVHLSVFGSVACIALSATDRAGGASIMAGHTKGVSIIVVLNIAWASIINYIQSPVI